MKLPKHYSQRELAEITGESPRTLRWWRSMGWLQPTKRTPCYERFTLEAYRQACASSAAYVPETPVLPDAIKKSAVAEPDNFFAELRKEFGLSTKPSKRRNYATG